VLGLGLIGLGLGSGGGWIAGAQTVQPLNIAEVRSFDPFPGDNKENNARLPALIDGARAAWKTENYSNGFAGLRDPKRGVGVVFDLGSSRSVESLRILSLTNNWNAVVYVADDYTSEFSSWGSLVRRADAVQNRSTVIGINKSGRYVMLWIDDLGPNTSVSIAEAELFG
jgi:hypothetical protein